MHTMIKNGKITWLAAFGMAVLLLIGMIRVPVYAGEQSGIMKITSAPASVKKGETVSVDVKLSGNPGIWGIQFEVDYDHSVLALESVTAGDVFAAEEVVLPEADNVKSLNEKGQSFTFVAAGTEVGDDSNNTKNGTLATLKFTVKDTAAKSDAGLLIRSVKAYQADEQKIDDKKISVFAGTVTVSDVSDDNKKNDQNGQDDPETPDGKDDKNNNNSNNNGSGNTDNSGSADNGNAGTGDSNNGSTSTGDTQNGTTVKKTTTNTSAKASANKTGTTDTSDPVNMAEFMASVAILLGAGGLLVGCRLVVLRRRGHSR